MFVPVAQIKNKRVSKLLDLIWDNRSNKSFTFKKLILTEEFKECSVLFKAEYAGILDEACKDVLWASQNFLNHEYFV
jgi:hypothetical protein